MKLPVLLSLAALLLAVPVQAQHGGHSGGHGGSHGSSGGHFGGRGGFHGSSGAHLSHSAPSVHAGHLSSNGHASVHGSSGNHGFPSVPHGFAGHVSQGHLVDSHHGSEFHSGFSNHGFGFDDHHVNVLHHDFDHDPFFVHHDHHFFGHHLLGSSFFVTSGVVATPVQPAPNPLTLLVLMDHSIYGVTDYWVENGRIFFVTYDGVQDSVPLDQIDLDMTLQLNRERGVQFVLRQGSRLR